MDEMQRSWEDETKPDYQKWIHEKSFWTYTFKHWWETELVLLSCGIDPNKVNIVRERFSLIYAGVPYNLRYDSRLEEAGRRNDLIGDAIRCGELTIKNVVTPDYTNPNEVYFINPLECLQWLKKKGLHYPPEFDKEVQVLIERLYTAQTIPAPIDSKQTLIASYDRYVIGSKKIATVVAEVLKIHQDNWRTVKKFLKRENIAIEYTSKSPQVAIADLIAFDPRFKDYFGR